MNSPTTKHMKEAVNVFVEVFVLIDIKMSVHINDLSFDLLKYILSFLPEKQQFAVESVCTKWQKCVKKLLAQKESLKCIEFYSNEFCNKPQGGWIIDNKNFYILKIILLKCPNIKELDFNYTIIKGDNNLFEIAKLVPQLQTIHLCSSKFYFSKKEMNTFAQIIGPQLIKISLYGTDIGLTKILFRYLKNIEEIQFNSHSKKFNQIFFRYLNFNCKNLKKLFWIIDDFENEIDFNDENMISVMQSISHLQIQLPVLAKFKFDSNNLVELELFSQHDLNVNDINEITFNNLLSLKITDFYEKDFIAISKLKFPKLESLDLNHYEVFNIPISFINQIKHINTLKSSFFIPLLVSSIKLFKYLINYECHEQTLADYSSTEIINCLEILSKHSPLENIKLNLLNHRYYNTELFEKFANFCQLKPNTEIVIKIPKSTISYVSFDVFNDYKTAFERTRYLNKINMKMILL